MLLKLSQTIINNIILIIVIAACIVSCQKKTTQQPVNETINPTNNTEQNENTYNNGDVIEMETIEEEVKVEEQKSLLIESLIPLHFSNRNLPLDYQIGLIQDTVNINDYQLKIYNTLDAFLSELTEGSINTEYLDPVKSPIIEKLFQDLINQANIIRIRIGNIDIDNLYYAKAGIRLFNLKGDTSGTIWLSRTSGSDWKISDIQIDLMDFEENDSTNFKPSYFENDE